MLVLILVGCVIRRCGIFSESFFPEINRLIFKFFLPVMLYNGIYMSLNCAIAVAILVLLYKKAHVLFEVK